MRRYKSFCIGCSPVLPNTPFGPVRVPAAHDIANAHDVDQGLFRAIDWQKLMPQRVTSDLSEAGGQMLRYRTVIPAILYNTAEAKWAASIKTFDRIGIVAFRSSTPCASVSSFSRSPR